MEERPNLEGHQNPYGLKPEAYDAACTVLARALESASRRNMTPERVTIFTDAQAAIRRVAPANSTRSRPESTSPRCGEPGRCHHRDSVAPSTQESRRQREGRRVGEGRSGRARRPRGGMAKLLGQTGARPMPLPRSLANLKREISEKRVEARRWAGGRASREKYKMPESHKPDGTVAGSTDFHEARLKVLPAEGGKLPHRRIPALDKGPSERPVLVAPLPLANERPPLRGVSGMEDIVEDSVGGSVEGAREAEETVDRPGSVRRREICAGGAGLPPLHGCGK